MSSDEIKYCSICGVSINADEHEVIDGKIVCEHCLKENFYQCDDCGNYVPKDEITQVGNSDHVCEACLQNNYSYCEECGEYERNEDMVYLDNWNKYVCEHCLENNYEKCYECGEYFPSDEIHWSDDNDPYCEDCYCDTFTSCDDCGCEIYRNDAYEHDGYYYCSECYANIEDDDNDEDDNGIYTYHGFNHNNYVPRYADNEEIVGTHLYGMELEVAGSTSYARDVVDLLRGNAIAMYDSSVDGFELVFMPMSRKYIYENLKPILEETLKFMTKKGFRGHNKGGIHVHFTKLANSMQVANMTQIMYGSEQDRKLWLKITQRKESAMHWCSMSSCVPSSQDIIDQNMLAPAGYGNHGTALNFCTRTDTHELRIFNSSTRIERVMQRLECVFALEDYVARASEPICDTRGFITYVDENAEKYPTLVEFFAEMKVFDVATKFYGDHYKNNIKKAEQPAEVEPSITITAEDVINAISEPVSDSDDLVGVAQGLPYLPPRPIEQQYN